MSYRGDLFSSVGSTALNKGLGAVAGLAGTAIGGPLGGLIGLGVGAILGGTIGTLFGESEQERSARLFDEAAKRQFDRGLAFQRTASPAQKRAMQRFAAARLRTRMIRAMRL